MKKTKLLSFITFLFIAIELVSCETEPIDPALVSEEPGNTAPAAFQVDFNGQTYQANTSQAAVIGSSMVLSAVKSDGSTFMITIPGTAVGTYNNATIMYTPNINAGTNYYINESDAGTNGVVNITSINTTTHKITGTFNFTGVFTGVGQPNVVFTNGIFTNITYTGTVPETPQTNAVFKVNHDGTTFTADTFYASVGVGTIQIEGYKSATGEDVMLTIFGTTTGTYTGSQVYWAEYVSSIDESDNYYSYAHEEDFYTSPETTVTITEVDAVNHTISGTFSFKGQGSGIGTGASENGLLKEFTGGVFTDIPYVTGDTEGDQVHATVDGVAYNYSVDVLYTESSGGFEVAGPNHRFAIHTDYTQGEGTYPFTDSEGFNTNWVEYRDANGVSYDIDNGSITITGVVEEVSVTGNYTFNVKNASGQVIHTVTGTFTTYLDF